MIPCLAWRARRRVDLDVSKPVKPVFCKNLAGKMMKYRLDKGTIRWPETWLKYQSSRVVISSTVSALRWAVYRHGYWDQYCLTWTLIAWMVGHSAASAGLQMIKSLEASADLQMIKSLEDWLLGMVVVLPIHRDLNWQEKQESHEIQQR